MSEAINQYDVFVLARDMNSVCQEGMEGVILEVLDADNFLVEFVKEDGTSYEFEEEATFHLDRSFIGAITYRHQP